MASLKINPENNWSIPYSSRKSIDDIPPEQRSKLCTEIDYTIHRNEGYWQKLIGRLGFDETHSKKFLLSFEMHGSPTDNLLRDCSYRMLRIRHLYHILMEIGLTNLAQEYLGEYDTEEDLPPIPTMNNSFNNLVSLRQSGSNPQNDSSFFQLGNEKGRGIQKGSRWLGIDTFHFSYEDIKKGTNNFSHKMELGAGAFGKVYKVILNNTLFACKVLKIDDDNPLTTSVIKTHRQHDDLRNELNYLAEYRHPNVIALYGWSLDGRDPCLIYDYMKNGSLQDRLQCLNGSKPLDWDIRARVSCGAATGLQFLHTMKSKPLIHGDIKTANILLDDSFTAKLGDFGLAREMPRNAATPTCSYIRLGNEHTPGTLGYLANEYITTKKLSVKVDTYAFGVVLLELYTGRRAYDRNKESPLLRDYMDDIAQEADEIGEEKAEEKLFQHQDPQITKLNKEIALKFVRLALSCCHEKRKERPEMSKTLTILNDIDHMLALANGREPEQDLHVPVGKDRNPSQHTGLIFSPQHGEHATNTVQRRKWMAQHRATSLAESEVPVLSRDPVESVDHSINADYLFSRHESIPGKSSKISSVEKQMDRMRIHYPSSSDESDSQGRSSTDTTNSGFYYVRGGPTSANFPTDQMHPGYAQPQVAAQGQFGYYATPLVSGYTGSIALHHPPHYHQTPPNVGDPLYAHAYPNGGRNGVRANEANDLYGPGPYSCPAGHGNHGNVKNPFNLDLSRVPKPPCTCNTYQHSQHNLSPLQSQIQWTGQSECAPETFTSLDLDSPPSILKPATGEVQVIKTGDLKPSDLFMSQAGYSNARSTPQESSDARETSFDDVSSTSTPPQPNSFQFQSLSDAGSVNLSSQPPLSINPVKELILDKLRYGHSYTEIFPDRKKRVPTESNSEQPERK